MIWAGFSAFGKTSLAFIDNRMNSQKYQEMLNQHLLPYLGRFRAANLVLMQDNASVHASKSTKEYLKRNNISTLDWPARSPDLNPIENLWGILVRDVYDNCRQYDMVQELKMAIQQAWERISTDQMSKLIKSMPKRVNMVIKSGGKAIKY